MEAVEQLRTVEGESRRADDPCESPSYSGVPFSSTSLASCRRLRWGPQALQDHQRRVPHFIQGLRSSWRILVEPAKGTNLRKQVVTTCRGDGYLCLDHHPESRALGSFRMIHTSYWTTGFLTPGRSEGISPFMLYSSFPFLSASWGRCSLAPWLSGPSSPKAADLGEHQADPSWLRWIDKSERARPLPSGRDH